MKFKINNQAFEIIEKSQKEIRTIIDNTAKQGLDDPLERCRYMGITCSDIGIIYLDKDLPNDKKRKVLMHELMHAYVDCFITNTNSFNLEALCDISANSHDMIHVVVEKYFSE